MDTSSVNYVFLCCTLSETIYIQIIIQLIDPSTDDKPQFINLCEECMSLIIKYLLPNERIKCFIICKQMKTILIDPENKTIWNDIRLSLKYSNNTNNINGCILPNLNDSKTEFEQFKLQFIHSQSSYHKEYKNCIQIEIDKQYKSMTNKFDNLWIFKCISNVEIFDNNATIYDNSNIFPNNMSLNNVKYLSLDCLYNGWNKLPKLIQLYPNINYLSFINVGHSTFPGTQSFKVIFNKFNTIKSLKYLQFWDCNNICFQNINISLENNMLSEIISLDLTFCCFTNINEIQNIFNKLIKLKYLSFISNGIDALTSNIPNVNPMANNNASNDATPIDTFYNMLVIPETLQYLKYASEILIDNRTMIHLDLKKLKKTNSLLFVDCCIDDVVLLEQISKYCQKSIKYILLNYDKSSHSMLHLHWDKYEIFNEMNAQLNELQIGINYMESISINDEMKQILKQFLMKTFMYDDQKVVSNENIKR